MPNKILIFCYNVQFTIYRKWLWIINFIEFLQSYTGANDCAVTVIPALDCGGSWGGWTLLFLQVASQSQVLHQLVTSRSQQDLPGVVWQQVLPVRKGKVCEKTQTSKDQNFNLSVIRKPLNLHINNGDE